MISFKDFYTLKESPDTVLNELPDGTEIRLNWENSQSYSFGFFNPPSTLDVKDLRGKLIMEDEGKRGSQKNHANVLYDFLQTNDRLDLIDSIKNLDARQLMRPAGRIWVQINKVNGEGTVNIISFWCPAYDVTSKHLQDVLNWFLIGEEDYDKTYLEFIGKDKSLIPMTEFKESSKPQKLSKEEKAEIQRKESEKHTTGGKKNPDFGSKKQATDADKAGERSYAEYKQKLDPYGFHGESHRPQTNS